jgi:hypothetical protein
MKEHYRKVQSLITTLKRYLKKPMDAKEKGVRMKIHSLKRIRDALTK